VCAEISARLGVAKLPKPTTVRVSQVVIPQRRMRQNFRDHTALAESMSEIGLLHPIGVSEENVLIYGLHRLRAANDLGWEEIDARVIGGDELDRELAEIDENLTDYALTVWEQGEHIARREEIMQARDERARRGDNLSTMEGRTTAGRPLKTNAELAAQMGVSKSTYKERHRLGRNLTAETKEILSDLDPNDTDLPNSTRQLNYLAGVDDESDQAEIARRVATGEAVSVWQASDQLKKERSIAEASEADEEYSYEIERIVRLSQAEYVVERRDGTRMLMALQALLKRGYHQCPHCKGLGIEPRLEPRPEPGLQPRLHAEGDDL
jgi:transcriptional regulator with XRE-family HTH domain